LKERAYKEDQHQGEARWSGNVTKQERKKHGKKLRRRSCGKKEKAVRAWLLHDIHYVEKYKEADEE